MYFANHTRGSGLRAGPLRATVDRLLAQVDAPGATVSLTLVRDPYMRDLNRAHRGLNVPTDVLSFPLHEPAAFDRRRNTRPATRGPEELMLGDVVISVDTAERQAAHYGAPLEREIDRLLIHGLLHLCGHDHIQAAERRRMEREERRLAAAIGMPWPYVDAEAVN